MRPLSFIVSSLALSFSLGISIIPVSHMGLRAEYICSKNEFMIMSLQ
jgi:hypothetical protein